MTNYYILQEEHLKNILNNLLQNQNPKVQDGVIGDIDKFILNAANI